MMIVYGRDLLATHPTIRLEGYHFQLFSTVYSLYLQVIQYLETVSRTRNQRT